MFGRNPVKVVAWCFHFPQGSSCLATLGFGAKSRWDFFAYVSRLQGGVLTNTAPGLASPRVRLAALQQVSGIFLAPGAGRFPEAEFSPTPAGC